MKLKKCNAVLSLLTFMAMLLHMGYAAYTYLTFYYNPALTKAFSLPLMVLTCLHGVTGMCAVMEGFAKLNCDGVSPDSEPARMQVKKLQQCITDNFYTCTEVILAGLGQMYAADERFQNNIDRHGEGTAAYIAECIKSYC